MGLWVSTVLLGTMAGAGEGGNETRAVSHYPPLLSFLVLNCDTQVLLSVSQSEKKKQTDYSM